MAGKRKNYDEKKQKYSVFLQRDTLQQLQELSEYLQTSLSELLELIFREYLQKHQYQEVNNENEKETEAEKEASSIHKPHGP